MRGDMARATPLILCGRHKKPLVYYCRTDNVCCAISECKNHEEVLVECERENRESLLWRKSVEVGICIEETERSWADREYRQSQGKVFFIFYSDSQYTGESTSIVNGEAYIENRFLFVVNCQIDKSVDAGVNTAHCIHAKSMDFTSGQGRSHGWRWEGIRPLGSQAQPIRIRFSPQKSFITNINSPQFHQLFGCLVSDNPAGEDAGCGDMNVIHKQLSICIQNILWVKFLSLKRKDVKKFAMMYCLSAVLEPIVTNMHLLTCSLHRPLHSDPRTANSHLLLSQEERCAVSPPTRLAKTTPGRCSASNTESSTGSWRCPSHGSTWGSPMRASPGRKRERVAWW
ncbi:unnamed protein product [Oncorhynchus mykiss]|uniref:Uncharacterized protein n=1 Tax=Oncorhynchus mykiss TaxID=8022 RepID=A0A060XK73_ONCMY|nr:unnamed protein product [Oncorhynchus mykiss]